MPFSQHSGGRGRQISEFQDSQGYTEKPCLKTNKQKKKNMNYTINKQLAFCIDRIEVSVTASQPSLEARLELFFSHLSPS